MTAVHAACCSRSSGCALTHEHPAAPTLLHACGVLGASCEGQGEARGLLPGMWEHRALLLGDAQEWSFFFLFPRAQILNAIILPGINQDLAMFTV